MSKVITISTCHPYEKNNEIFHIAFCAQFLKSSVHFTLTAELDSE